jgi:hypothetical protein
MAYHHAGEDDFALSILLRDLIENAVKIKNRLNEIKELM